MAVYTFRAEPELKAEALLGEGPVWDAAGEKLYWVDILSGILNEYHPATRVNKQHKIGEHPGATVLREKGGLVLAMKSGFAFFEPETGKSEKIADPEAHLPGNRFNDGKCDPAGRFWAGTLAYDLEKGKGSLYCLNPDLTIEQKLTGVTISNGLAWNEAGDLFYFIDTFTQQISAFDFDLNTGNIRNQRAIKKLENMEGFPDGMAIDENGCLWVALYNGGRVVCVNPEDGVITTEVHLPVPKPTSCAFGGKELDELYITTCREHMSEQEIEKAPLSGSLFKVKLPVKGLPIEPFSG